MTSARDFPVPEKPPAPIFKIMRAIWVVAAILHWPLYFFTFFHRKDVWARPVDFLGSLLIITAGFSLIAAYIHLAAPWWTASFEHPTAVSVIDFLRNTGTHALLLPYYAASVWIIICIIYWSLTDDSD